MRLLMHTFTIEDINTIIQEYKWLIFSAYKFLNY